MKSNNDEIYDDYKELNIDYLQRSKSKTFAISFTPFSDSSDDDNTVKPPVVPKIKIPKISIQPRMKTTENTPKVKSHSTKPHSTRLNPIKSNPTKPKSTKKYSTKINSTRLYDDYVTPRKLKDIKLSVRGKTPRKTMDIVPSEWGFFPGPGIIILKNLL